MPKTEEDRQKLLIAAYALFLERSEEISRKEAVEILKEDVPGFTDRQYRNAWSRVRALFENACRLVFRWANANKTGTTFELPDSERVFLDELISLSRGFSDEQYDEALEYAFRSTIF